MKEYKWHITLAFECLLIALFYMWIASGSDGARNVILFIFWFTGFIGVAGGWTMTKNDFDETSRSRAWITYHAATDIAYICTLAWLGYVTTATVYALACCLMHAAKKREPKSATI